MNRIIKDSFKLFHFGLELSNPLVDEFQATLKFALDEQSSRLDLGNVLLHPSEVNMHQADKIDHQ